MALHDERLPPALRSRDPRESVLEDVAPYRDTTPEERAREVDSLCSLAMELLRAAGLES